MMLIDNMVDLHRPPVVLRCEFARTLSVAWCWCHINPHMLTLFTYHSQWVLLPSLLAAVKGSFNALTDNVSMQRFVAIANIIVAMVLMSSTAVSAI